MPSPAELEALEEPFVKQDEGKPGMECKCVFVIPHDEEFRKVGVFCASLATFSRLGGDFPGVLMCHAYARTEPLAVRSIVPPEGG